MESSSSLSSRIISSSFTVSKIESWFKSTSSGFATALQYMHPGDRWEIWIPQALGYGSAGSASRQQSDGTYSTEIKPYTTLIYEIEVTRVTEP